MSSIQNQAGDNRARKLVRKLVQRIKIWARK